MIFYNKQLSGMSSTVKYFAYGSNLLQKRIHVNIPSAKRCCVGELQKYRLDFNFWSKRWGGNAATIVSDKSAHVWGAIWEIESKHIPELDRQEGVDAGVYQVMSVEVQNSQGEVIKCRSYQLCKEPEYSPVLPESRYPSKIYLDTIIEGAIESGLPTEYINILKAIPHNNFDGPVQLEVRN